MTADVVDRVANANPVIPSARRTGAELAEAERVRIRVFTSLNATSNRRRRPHRRLLLTAAVCVPALTAGTALAVEELTVQPSQTTVPIGECRDYAVTHDIPIPSVAGLIAGCHSDGTFVPPPDATTTPGNPAPPQSLSHKSRGLKTRGSARAAHRSSR
jgi:hypothetical protein